MDLQNVHGLVLVGKMGKRSSANKNVAYVLHRDRSYMRAPN